VAATVTLSARPTPVYHAPPHSTSRHYPGITEHILDRAGGTPTASKSELSMALSDLGAPYRASRTPVSASRVHARAESRSMARARGMSEAGLLSPSRSGSDPTSIDLAKGFQGSSQDLLADKPAREKAGRVSLGGTALLMTPGEDDTRSPRWDRSCTFSGSLDELQHGELLQDEHEHEPARIVASDLPSGMKDAFR